MQAAERAQRPPPQSTQSEANVGSSRRRKGTRRRIVDLAGDDGFAFQSQSIDPQQDDLPSTLNGEADRSADEHALSPNAKHIAAPASNQPALAPSALSKSSSSPSSPLLASAPRISDRGQSLAHEIQHHNLDGEAYRLKVEALKTEVGSNWLNVLSEEGWHSHGKNDQPLPTYPPPGLARPEISNLRMQSQGIISGSRSLG